MTFQPFGGQKVPFTFYFLLILVGEVFELAKGKDGAIFADEHFAHIAAAAFAEAAFHTVFEGGVDVIVGKT